MTSSPHAWPRSELGPELSVIIPSFNRKPILLRALQALCEQDMPATRFEIVVADDGSSDGTREAVEAFAAQHPPPQAPYIRCSSAPNQGANAARNRAIRLATGRLLVIINDDTIAVPGFLSAHLAEHQAYPDLAVAVLGRMTISPDVPPSLFADLHLDAWFAQFTDATELDWKGFVTCNLSVKAELLHRHGMFEERMRWHEDLELGERLRAQGLRVRYRRDALGYHLHHLRERDFLGVADREGVSLAEWYAKNPALGPTIAEIGFHPFATAAKRVQYRLADAMFNPWFYPAGVRLARALSTGQPALAQKLYLKLYQAQKRRATRRRLHELGIRGLPA